MKRIYFRGVSTVGCGVNDRSNDCLPECLITLIALVRLLIGVHQHVRFKMPGRNRCIWTQITFVAFFAFVSLGVNLRMENRLVNMRWDHTEEQQRHTYLVAVSVWVRVAASFAFQRLVCSVQFLHVNP